MAHRRYPLRISLNDIRERLAATKDRLRRRQLRSIRLILLGATVLRAQKFAQVGRGTFEKWVRVAKTKSLEELFAYWQQQDLFLHRFRVTDTRRAPKKLGKRTLQFRTDADAQRWAKNRAKRTSDPRYAVWANLDPKALRAKAKRAKRRTVARRYEALALVAEGASFDDAAMIVGCSAHVVGKWLTYYQEGRLDKMNNKGIVMPFDVRQRRLRVQLEDRSRLAPEG